MDSRATSSLFVWLMLRSAAGIGTLSAIALVAEHLSGS